MVVVPIVPLEGRSRERVGRLGPDDVGAVALRREGGVLDDERTARLDRAHGVHLSTRYHRVSERYPRFRIEVDRTVGSQIPAVVAQRRVVERPHALRAEADRAAVEGEAVADGEVVGTLRDLESVIEMPDFAIGSAVGVAVPDAPFRDAIACGAASSPGSARRTSTWPGLRSLDGANSTGTGTSACAGRGIARDWRAAAPPRWAGRVPANPSGGFTGFGEGAPAQAVTQACERTWQLRGRVQGRQMEGARVGIAIDRGLLGHGSSLRGQS